MSAIQTDSRARRAVLTWRDVSQKDRCLEKLQARLPNVCDRPYFRDVCKRRAIDRNCLTREEYAQMLSTPRGYTWMGQRCEIADENGQNRNYRLKNQLFPNKKPAATGRKSKTTTLDDRLKKKRNNGLGEKSKTKMKRKRKSGKSDGQLDTKSKMPAPKTRRNKKTKQHYNDTNTNKNMLTPKSGITNNNTSFGVNNVQVANGRENNVFTNENPSINKANDLTNQHGGNIDENSNRIINTGVGNNNDNDDHIFIGNPIKSTNPNDISPNYKIIPVNGDKTNANEMPSMSQEKTNNGFLKVKSNELKANERQSVNQEKTNDGFLKVTSDEIKANERQSVNQEKTNDGFLKVTSDEIKANERQSVNQEKTNNGFLKVTSDEIKANERQSVNQEKTNNGFLKVKSDEIKANEGPSMNQEKTNNGFLMAEPDEIKANERQSVNQEKTNDWFLKVTSDEIKANERPSINQEKTSDGFLKVKSDEIKTIERPSMNQEKTNNGFLTAESDEIKANERPSMNQEKTNDGGFLIAEPDEIKANESQSTSQNIKNNEFFIPDDQLPGQTDKYNDDFKQFDYLNSYINSYDETDKTNTNVVDENGILENSYEITNTPSKDSKYDSEERQVKFLNDPADHKVWLKDYNNIIINDDPATSDDEDKELTCILDELKCFSSTLLSTDFDHDKTQSNENEFNSLLVNNKKTNFSFKCGESNKPPKHTSQWRTITNFQEPSTATCRKINTKKPNLCDLSPGVNYQICKGNGSYFKLRKTILPVCENNVTSIMDEREEAKLAVRTIREVDSWKFDKCSYKNKLRI